MPDTLLDHCLPRVINLPNTADGSLTKADIKGMTPAEFVNLEGKGTGEIAMLYRQIMRAKISGVKEHNLYDLVMSRSAPAKKSLSRITMGNKSYFLPYMMKMQEDYINAAAFVISAGQVSSRAGNTVGGITYPAHAWEIVVENSASPYSSAIKWLARYFLPQSRVVVLNLSGAGAAQEPYFTVINAEDNSETSATITLVPNISAAGFAALSGPNQVIRQPEAGVVQLGVNSVSDYESWCHNQPAELSNRLLHFWFETNRYVESYDDETLKYLNYIKAGNVNDYLDIFRTLDMTEYNRRQYAQYQRNFLNDFFYADIINEFQTAETYQSLPKVNGQMGEFLEYKAHAVGVKNLLRECGRVIDYAGAPLDINVLEEQLLQIRRHREVDGGTVREIDIMGGLQAAIRFDQTMMSYYKAQGRADWQRQYEPSKIAGGLLWDYRSYDMLNAQVKVNFIIEPYFDDHKEHFAGSLAPRGNKMLILDWADIQNAIAATSSRMAKTPDLETDPTLPCVMKTNVMHHKLESIMRTLILEDPTRHLWIDNFSDGCPTYDYTLCEAENVT